MNTPLSVLRHILCSLLLLLAWPSSNEAQDQMDYPGEVCVWFVNQDGSCVQCSISNCGVWHNDPNAATLLFDSANFGSRVRGGSSPSRVEGYADRRQIPIYNVTGEPTWEWMKWVAKTGRMAAIGYFSSHFQTEIWYNPDPSDPKPWKVRNNWYNTTSVNNEYTESQFRHYHLASGQWIVVLKAPPPPMQPLYTSWWKNDQTIPTKAR